MSKDKQPWWRWPENRMTGRVAWFVALRRLVCLPLLIVGLLLYVIAIALGWGIKPAKLAWKDML